MSKRNKIKTQPDNNYLIINALQEAFDRLEGGYSNIPECCIEGYINGRTWMNVKNSIPEKEVKKLSKWNYVPCDSCYKKNKINKLKLNGISELGEILYSIIQILKNRESRNERKPTKRSKK